jgi:hypothetical protein
MANMHASYFPRRANLRVNNLSFASEVNMNGQVRVDLGAPVVAAPAGIMAAVDLTAIVTRGGTLVPTFDPDVHMGTYGRNVTVTLSGAGTPTVTVRGRDYLGQPMVENIVATGAAAAVGKKAFKSVDNVTTSAAVASTTLALGYGTLLGLPYAMLKVSEEYINDAVAGAGTITLATPAQTITSADPRGSYVPALAPDGVRNWYLIGTAQQSQLHGVPHFYS